jgi:hypothetical protein
MNRYRAYVINHFNPSICVNEQKNKKNFFSFSPSHLFEYLPRNIIIILKLKKNKTTHNKRQ